MKLQEFTTELRNILGEFQTDTKSVLEDVASEINRAVEQSLQGMEQQRTIFKENADEVTLFWDSRQKRNRKYAKKFFLKVNLLID